MLGWLAGWLAVPGHWATTSTVTVNDNICGSLAYSFLVWTATVTCKRVVNLLHPICAHLHDVLPHR